MRPAHWRALKWLARRAGRARSALLVCFALVAVVPSRASALEADLSRPGVEGGATRVEVGLFLADLHDVSGSDQAFLADVVLQALWHDPRLAGRWPSVRGVGLDEVWNPRLQLVNQRGVTTSFPQRVEVDPSGLVRYRQRWLGRFSTRMDLRDFPLDRQLFGVQVVSLGYSSDEVELVLNSKDLPSGRAGELSLTDWQIGPARIETAAFEPGPGAKLLAGAALRWEGRRLVGYYAVQVVLPLVLIVLLGWLALWVNPAVVPARVSMSVTAMLTLIAYRFSLGKSVPNLTYLTRFDYFMLGSTVLVFLSVAVVAAGAYLIDKDRMPLVRRIDGWGRVLFPVALALVFGLAWWG